MPVGDNTTSFDNALGGDGVLNVGTVNVDDANVSDDLAVTDDATIGGDSTVGGVAKTSYGVGAKNGATVTATEYGNGPLHQTVLTLAATPVTVTRVTNDSSGYGGVKLYDFPAGRIAVLGCIADLTVTGGANIAATGSGDFSLGSTITTDTTLDSTDIDLCASTGLTDPFVAKVGNGKGALAASAQFDGTTTALDANLNLIFDAGDVTTGNTSATVSGTVTLTWVQLGDY